MIKEEIIEKDKRVRHYSDKYKIRQVETGIVYCDAVDVIPCHYTYEETDELLTEPSSESEEDIEEGDM